MKKFYLTALVLGAAVPLWAQAPDFERLLQEQKPAFAAFAQKSQTGRDERLAAAQARAAIPYDKLAALFEAASGAFPTTLEEVKGWRRGSQPVPPGRGHLSDPAGPSGVLLVGAQSEEVSDGATLFGSAFRLFIFYSPHVDYLDPLYKLDQDHVRRGMNDVKLSPPMAGTTGLQWTESWRSNNTSMMSFELRKSQEYLILRTTWGALWRRLGRFRPTPIS